MEIVEGRVLTNILHVSGPTPASNYFRSFKNHKITFFFLQKSQKHTVACKKISIKNLLRPKFCVKMFSNIFFDAFKTTFPSSIIDTSLMARKAEFFAFFLISWDFEHRKSSNCAYTRILTYLYLRDFYPAYPHSFHACVKSGVFSFNSFEQAVFWRKFSS